MDLILISNFADLNWTGVIISAVTTFILGFTWYHWKVFGKAWATALGMSKEEADNLEGMGGAFIFSIVSGIVKAIFLALLIEGLGIHEPINGLFIGLVIGAAFVSSSIIYQDSFARRSPTVSYINSLHVIVELSLIGAIYSCF